MTCTHQHADIHCHTVTVKSDGSVWAQTVLNIAWGLMQEENHNREMEELLQAFGNPAFSF